MGRLSGGTTVNLLTRVPALMTAIAQDASDSVLEPLRRDLQNMTCTHTPRGLRGVLNYSQLESFLVLTMVERRLEQLQELAAEPGPDPGGLPPPATERVA